MTYEQAQKLEAACEAAGIDTYIYATDMPTYHLNNNKNAFTIIDSDGVHAFSKNGFGGAHNYLPTDSQVCYNFAEFVDVHEFKTAGTKEQIMKFVEQVGLTLSEDQVKILTWIDSVRNDLKPITGDYTFKLLTEEEYEALTEEEKAKYDAAKKQHDLEKAGISGKASVSVQIG